MRRKWMALLSGLLCFLFLSGCVDARPSEDPLLELYAHTRRSDDVQMDIPAAFGTTPDSFFLYLHFQNNSDKNYIFDDPYILEKQQDSGWVIIEQDPSIRIGVDLSRNTAYSLSPGRSSLYRYPPLMHMLGPLDAGTYRLSVRLYDEAAPQDGYILVSGTFNYPAQALPWQEDRFPYAENFTQMEIRVENGVSALDDIPTLTATFTMPESAEGQRANILDARCYLQRRDNRTWIWETAPYLTGRDQRTGSISHFLGNDFRYSYTPSYVYGPFQSDLTYRLILEVDYCYDDYDPLESQVLTASFSGEFTVADPEAG